MKEYQGMCCDSNGCRMPTDNADDKPVIKIKMFSDYMCAWCYLADAMLNSLKDRYDFEIEHIGFELHEGTPEDGEDMNKNHPGTPQTIAYINQQGEKYELHLCELPILANTKKALIVGEYAKEQGKGKEYVHAMWKAYMVEGKNISLISEIENAAQTVGISVQEVKNALENTKYAKMLQDNMKAGWSYELNSVPTFIINDEYKVTGAQQPEVFAGIFDEILAKNSKHTLGEKSHET